LSEWLADRYEGIRLLGRGAMGEVWLARDTILQRDVAIKRIATTPGGTWDVALVDRMVREARLAAALHHPHVVGVFDIVRDSAGIPHVIMEYIAGESLAEILRREGRVDPAEAARLMAGICAALTMAHARGILHRDIKPANILVDHRGEAKLADFGIARLTGREEAALTRTGEFIGTIHYLAPEIALGHDATAASDMYAVGATLFTLVEGRAPLDSGRDEATAAQLVRLVSEPTRVPRQAGPLQELIVALLDREPQHRPDAQTTSSWLSEVALGRPVADPPVAATVLRSSGPDNTSALDGLAGAPTRTAPAPADGHPTGPASPPSISHNRRGGLLIGAAAGILVIGGFAAFALTRPAATPSVAAVAGTASTSSTLSPTSPASTTPGSTPTPPPTPASMSTPTVTVTVPAPIRTTAPQPATPAPLASPASGCATQRFSKGSTAACVNHLQALYNYHAKRLWGGSSIPVDGDFGPVTDSALRAYQTRMSLVVDGVVGPQTWGALCTPPNGSSPGSAVPADFPLTRARDAGCANATSWHY